MLPGQDELNGKYQRLAKKLKVDRNVLFLDNRNDIPKLLKISNIAVSSSKREGLPLNILESLASNLPVISRDCRGSIELTEKTPGCQVFHNKAQFLSQINKYSTSRKSYNYNKYLKKYSCLSTLIGIAKIYGVST